MASEVLKSRQHFHILDGLRGIAAIAVVAFHFIEWSPELLEKFMGHGYLAVDFFFCLSGFVIAYAYDNRIKDMKLLDFFKLRLIRLHPMVVFGSVIGLLALLFEPFCTDVEALSVGRIVVIFVCSLFLIPHPINEGLRGGNLFGLNAPSWSLFWEYIANIVYALVLCRLNKKYLVGVLVVAAGLLSVVAYNNGILSGGWSGGTFWQGGARLLYSFTAGLLIFRYKLILKNKLGFIVLSLILFALLAVPNFQSAWIYQLIVVCIVFPFIVSLGAGSTLSSGMEKICILSGKISYPLYMTHYVVIWAFGQYFIDAKPGGLELALIITIGTILLVGFAYLTLKYFDEPVRKYLSQKFKKSMNKRVTK